MKPTHATHSGNGDSPSATQLAVDGMTCNNCARHVTEAIQRVPGVRSASVHLEERRATVRWGTGSHADVPALIEAIKEAGYEARPVESAAHDHEHKTAGWQITLWVGALGTIPLMIGEWIFGLSMTPWFRWASFAIAGVVQVVSGAQFYRGAWRQLKIGSSNMDTLVALGSTTAFVYSVWALFTGHGGHLYFMEAAAIITLVSLGHWIEARVSSRASGALKALLNLAPHTARRRDLNGTESEVSVAELKLNDQIVLRPGERVPTDAEVTEGASAVDESMLTGESTPVDKKTGNNIYAGTVNLNGRLIARVTATGESTALANVIAAVQRAQNSRANIQRLGDYVSSIFVPIVVVIAIAAAVWWGVAPESARQTHAWLAQFLWTAHPPVGTWAAAFIIASAVLIIACPCAMGLATPAAIMAGSNAAAQRGILIRDGVALEKAGQVTAVIFDKTGTLTSGKPAVAETWIAESNEKKLPPPLSLAAALAQQSNHPISNAVAHLASDSVPLTNWQEVHGSGVQGTIEVASGNFALAQFGSLNWLRESGVNLETGKVFTEKWTASGATVVGLAVEKQLLALAAVKDTTKAGSADVIRQLREHGLKIFLVTGDNRRTAESIATTLGIERENVFAEVRPERKAEFVRQLQQRGERVAFVGDGINDAPALEQAELGIAVMRASDIAREAADIILLNSEIGAVPEALGLARATLRTIKQNLFWAFFYNAIGVPLAALGFLSPVLCAAAMGFSDLVVIGNALRLRRWGK